MSSQQFPRSGAPPAALGANPPTGPAGGTAGLIAPAATSKRDGAGLCAAPAGGGGAGAAGSFGFARLCVALALDASLLSAASDESVRDPEVAPREQHLGPGAPAPPREEKQEPVVVRPYPQVQMLAPHHPVPPGAPVTVAAPPAHLAPAVPLSFSDGLMKVRRGRE